MDKFRIAVLPVSVIMFFIQLNIALNKLISPPKLDSTSKRNLAEKDLPIITICPKNQENCNICPDEHIFIANQCQPCYNGKVPDHNQTKCVCREDEISDR